MVRSVNSVSEFNFHSEGRERSGGFVPHSGEGFTINMDPTEIVLEYLENFPPRFDTNNTRFSLFM